MTRSSVLLLGLLPLLLSCGDGGPSGPLAQPVVIATSSFPDAAVGTPYSASLAATGGTGSHAWSVESGALPAGLSLSVGGAVTGTPTTPGISAFTVRATSGNESATRGFAISVLPPGVVIGTASLPDGMVGTPYSQSLTASGGTGTHSWSLASGTLPAGLALSGLGTISGTPTAPGTSTFTVQAASGGQTATRVLAITIGMPPLSVTSVALADGVVGVAYGETLAAVGGSGAYGWSMAGGSLPAGLSLSTAGTISGTPTAAGASSFTVRVTSGSQQATRPLTITVASPSVGITTTSLPDGVLGQAYSQTLRAVGGTGTYEWGLAGGALPAGLTLSAAGVIDGTPAASGVSTFTVRATSGGQTAALALTITVQLPPLSVTTTTLPDGTLGAAYTQQLTATGGTGTYTWSLSVGTPPAGLTLSASGLLAGTPTSLGATTFTVRVSSGSASATRELAVNVVAPPVVISTTTLPAGKVGQAYNQALAASGGTGTYTWTLAAGTPPAGLTLSAAGVLAGTPTAVGTSIFSVRASSGGREATQQLTLTIGSALPPVVIVTASLPPGNVGEPYGQALVASGGDGTYAWSIPTDTLPSGLSLSQSGVITGTPTAAGTVNFTVRVASGDQAATASLSLTIGAALPDVVITTSSLPAGTVGVQYSQQLAATGGNGSYAWSLDPASGPLPQGLTISGAGIIAGTPTTAAGPITFTVRAVSGSKVGTRQLSITIIAAGAAVVITTTTLPNAVVGTSYSQKLVATGGDTIYPYIWSIASGQEPAGITLLEDGTLSGTPTSAGSSTFTVRATRGGLNDTQVLTLTVEAVLNITTTTLPGGTARTAYSQTLAAAGGDGTYAWSLVPGSGQLPDSLSLSAAGVIAGTPTAAGTSSFSVRVASGIQADTQALSLTIAWPPVNITTTTLPGGTVGTAYSQRLSATGGDGTSYAWAVSSGSLPAGLTLAGDTIKGTPTDTGTSTFTVQASSGGLADTQVLSIVVVWPPVIVTTPTLAHAVIGKPYLATLSASGGNGTYAWTVSVGVLPDGLTLSGDTIKGTPTSAGSRTFTVQAASAGSNGTKEFTLTVEAVLNITTTTLPGGTARTPYSQALAASGGDGTYAWSLVPGSGQLPDSLSLSAAGVIAGTPTAAGTSSFSVRVASGIQADTQALSLTIAWPPVNITTTTLPGGTVGTAYSQRLSATGGDGTSYAWAVSSGSLPAGLTLAGDTIKGTPTDTGTSTFTVQATSGGLTDTQQLSLTVQNAGGQGLTITTGSLPNAIINQAYSQALAATGGTGSYSWSLIAGSLPDSMHLSAAGLLTGTPVALGTSSFTVQVASGLLTASQNLTLTVSLPPVTITTTTLPDGARNIAYSQTLTASGGNGVYAWALVGGTLPAGITLSAAGQLAGTPTNPGSHTFTVQATSGDQSTTKSLTLRIKQ